MTLRRWALGVVLYECLTGQIPFPGSSIAEVSTRILTIRPSPPPVDHPIPDALLAVIHRCLEKDPGRRYDNLAELATALSAFAPAAAEKSIGYLAELGPALPPLPKKSNLGPDGARIAGAMATTEVALTAQGQTFDTRQDAAKRRPVTLAIVAFAVATGAATYFATKRVESGAVVSSEPPAPSFVRVEPVRENIPLTAASSREPSVAPSVNPLPTASLSVSAAAKAPQIRARKPRRNPLPERGKEAAPAAPWVDSR